MTVFRAATLWTFFFAFHAGAKELIYFVDYFAFFNHLVVSCAPFGKLLGDVVWFSIFLINLRFSSFEIGHSNFKLDGKRVLKNKFVSNILWFFYLTGVKDSEPPPLYRRKPDMSSKKRIRPHISNCPNFASTTPFNGSFYCMYPANRGSQSSNGCHLYFLRYCRSKQGSSHALLSLGLSSARITTVFCLWCVTTSSHYVAESFQTTSSEITHNCSAAWECLI